MSRKLRAIIVAIILGLGLAVPAGAQQATCGNGSCYPSPFSTPLPTAPIGVSYRAITGVGTTIVKASPGVFYGITSFGVQVGVTTCYDNASAASGQVIGGGLTLGLGGTNGPITGLGRIFVNGLTCSQTISLIGSIIVDYQ